MMTGEQLYRRVQDALLGAEKPGALLYDFSEIVRRFCPELWREFEAAMCRHGYNPHNVDGDKA